MRLNLVCKVAFLFFLYLLYFLFTLILDVYGPSTFLDKWEGSIKASTFFLHEVGHDIIRGQVHPSISNLESYLIGQPCIFVPGKDTLVGGDGKNRMFIENGRLTTVS